MTFNLPVFWHLKLLGRVQGTVDITRMVWEGLTDNVELKQRTEESGEANIIYKYTNIGEEHWRAQTTSVKF